MHHSPRHRIALAIALFASLAAQGAGAQASQAGSEMTAELAAAKTALAKYRDPIVAIHDGYLSTMGCMSYPKGAAEGTMSYKPGAMGVHFLNLAYVGQPLAADKPQVLMYEPRGDKLELIGAEWFVPVQASGGVRPSIFGKELEGPMAGHKPIMPEGLAHYDLHVWLWRENPNGMFHATNSAVKCPAGAHFTFVEDAPKAHQHKP
jgi:hypothetical protein